MAITRELQPMSEMKQASEFVALADEKADLEQRLKKIKGRIAKIEPDLIEWLIENECRTISINGRTVYLHRQMWAGAKADEDPEVASANRAALLDALRSDESTEFLAYDTFNTHTLSAFVRELGVDPETFLPVLPDHLIDLVGVTEKTSVRTRKAEA